MSAKRISMTWPVLMLLILGIAALAVAGTYLLSDTRSDAVESGPDFQPGDADRRTERLAPRDAPAQDPPAQGEPAREQTPRAPAPDTPPGVDTQLDALMERLAADRQRLEERRRLASESPLTPGVEDAAELARQGRQGGTGDKAGRVQGNLPPGQDGTRSGPAVAGTATGLDQPPTYLLARGSVIPAVLQTPLDSDLPGLVRAQVSEDVRDSASGGHVLIPRGSQLVGTYGSDARTGQKRLFIAWTDLRLPETETTLDLDRTGTLGADGASGVRARRATGLLAALGAAVLFDLAGNATAILTDGESASSTDGDLATLIAAATGNATSRVADRYLGELLSRGPRFRVKAGARMNVLVEADLRLPAWEAR